jgi:hypothetical protein
MLDPVPEREDGLRTFGSYAGEAPQVGDRGLVQVDGIVGGRSPARRPVSRIRRSGVHRRRWSGRCGGRVRDERRERSGRGIAMSALRGRLYRSVANGRLDRRIVRSVRSTSERRSPNRGEDHESEHGSRGANDGRSPSPRRGLLPDLDEPEGQLPTSRSHRLHGRRSPTRALRRRRTIHPSRSRGRSSGGLPRPFRIPSQILEARSTRSLIRDAGWFAAWTMGSAALAAAISCRAHPSRALAAYRSLGWHRASDSSTRRD